MTIIRCGGCEAIHDSTLRVCPSCGRCPGCGRRRVSKKDLPAIRRCSECSGSICISCGRCHQCGGMWSHEIETCGCGFPEDPEALRKTEETFRIDS